MFFIIVNWGRKLYKFSASTIEIHSYYFIFLYFTKLTTAQIATITVVITNIMLFQPVLGKLLWLVVELFAELLFTFDWLLVVVSFWFELLFVLFCLLLFELLFCCLLSFWVLLFWLLLFCLLSSCLLSSFLLASCLLSSCLLSSCLLSSCLLSSFLLSSTGISIIFLVVITLYPSSSSTYIFNIQFSLTEHLTSTFLPGVIWRSCPFVLK